MEPHAPPLPVSPPAPSPVPLAGADAPGSPPAAPRLSVVVVNYRQWEDTAALARRLQSASCWRAGAAEVVVVDNASPPDPAAARLRRAPGVSLRRWRRNRGFAQAVNEGCRLSRGDWLLLLNPDVTPDADFLDAALALADRRAAADPTAGVFGFRLRDPDGGRQRSTGPFPTLAGTLLRLLLPRPRRKYDGGPAHERRRVDWATGCCLLVRRACWKQLGGLDPDFFLYYEDVDLCRRARAAGWSVWYEPEPSVVHRNPLHARTPPPHLRLFTRHALLTYGLKHWSLWQVRILSAVVRAEAWARRCAARLRGDAAAAVFADLGAVAAELGRGRQAAAGRLLRRVVQRLEGPRADPVRRRPQP
jgi:GT2 family glycosyltransferase